MPFVITGEELEGCWHAPALWYPEHVSLLLHVETWVDDDRLRHLKPTRTDSQCYQCPSSHGARKIRVQGRQNLYILKSGIYKKNCN